MIDALATLPPKARVVVVMRYWADLSVNEVAELLGCSPGNVKARAPGGWTSCARCRAIPAGLDQPPEERHETEELRHGMSLT